MSSGTKRKTMDNLSSHTSSSSDTISSVHTSDSIYEPTQSDIEEADAEEQEDEEEETEDEFSADEDSDTQSGFTFNEKSIICDFTIRLMEQDLIHYTGIPKESSYVIDLIVKKSGVSKRNVLLILRKIRHDETFKVLGDLFGISHQQAAKMFARDIEKVSTCLQPFIYWPEPSYIQWNLPLQFKHKYKHVNVIIDCFEISIGKPRKPVDQALSWSQYKHSNTVKYLIGCTPDGVIIFVSKGFLGRISDNEIVRRSGFLNFLKKGTCVMVDRGFKDLDSEILSIGAILIKPPSVTAGVIYTTEEAKLCKSVAATRIHVERVIGKIRNFDFLKPHPSLLSSKRAYLIEYSIIIASAICNMQGLLTKI